MMQNYITRHAILIVCFLLALASAPLSAIEPLPVRYSLSGEAQERWNALHQQVAGADCYYIYAPDVPNAALDNEHYIFGKDTTYIIRDASWSIALQLSDPCQIRIRSLHGLLEEMVDPAKKADFLRQDISGKTLVIMVSPETGALLAQAWTKMLTGEYSANVSGAVYSIVGLRGMSIDGHFQTIEYGMHTHELVGSFSNDGEFSMASDVDMLGFVLFKCLFTEDPFAHQEAIVAAEQIARRIIRLSNEQRSYMTWRLGEIQALFEPIDISARPIDPFAPPPMPQVYYPPIDKEELAKIRNELAEFYVEYYQIQREEADAKATKYLELLARKLPKTSSKSIPRGRFEDAILP